MRLSIPFYQNNVDGNQCMQIAMKSVLKYFLNKDFSIEELDCLTSRKKGFWTWTPQIVTVLHDLGLKVKYFSKTDLEPFLEGDPFIRKYFGKDAEKILKFTDLPVLLESIKKLQKYSIFEKRILSFEEIEVHIQQGHIPLMLIDYNKIMDRDALYQGHFVVITGFDGQNVYYHESGPEMPEANKKVSKPVFIDAWNANGTDNDVIIVYGKNNIHYN